MITLRVGFRRLGGERAFRDPLKPAEGDASTRHGWSDIDDEDDDEQLEIVLKSEKENGGDAHGNVGRASGSSSGSGTHGNVSADTAAAGSSSQT
eukprot:7588634-Karenia_brevis.AAC.1